VEEVELVGAAEEEGDGLAVAVAASGGRRPRRFESAMTSPRRK
jgi:hypothetical protein